MKKIGGWIKKNKKKVIVLSILLILILFISMFVRSCNKAANAMLEAMNQVEIHTMEKRSLVSSVSATGSIISPNKTELSVNLTSVEVEKLYVEIGDYVEAGELIVEFNADDIETSLANTKKNLNANSGKTNISVESSNRSLEEAKTAAAIDASRNEKDVTDKYNDLEEARKDLEQAKKDLEQAKYNANYSENLSNQKQSEMNAYQAQITTEKINFEQAKRELTEIYTDSSYDFSGINIENLNLNTLNSASINPILTNEIDDELKNLVSIQTKFNEATALFNQASAEYVEAQRNYSVHSGSISSYEGLITQAEATVDTKLSAYEQQVRVKEDSERNNKTAISNQEDNFKTNQLTASTIGLTEKQQIEQYETQLEETKIVSPFSGVITSLSVEEGKKYNGGSILTIEEISKYEVSAEIDEYDISKIKVGQKVIIKTNGTGDLELDGEISYIAPRATVVTAGSTSGITYNIKIDVITLCDDLKLDMTAKLSIIIDSKEDILTVPYNAIQLDDENRKFVEVIKGENLPENREKIYVTTGIESDYYVEILEGDLDVGMDVVVISETQSFDLNSIMMGGGPMSGF
ncbi:MAG: HlyD family efflux transporter periplasmic adaptor subunit [Lachnospiraceae bacterium]